VKPNVSIDSERISGELGYVLVLLDRFEQGQQPRDSHENWRERAAASFVHLFPNFDEK